MSDYKTLGQLGYEIDVENKPTYHTGEPRKSWDQLGSVERGSWERPPCTMYNAQECINTLAAYIDNEDGEGARYAAAYLDQYFSKLHDNYHLMLTHVREGASYPIDGEGVRGTKLAYLADEDPDHTDLLSEDGDFCVTNDMACDFYRETIEEARQIMKKVEG